MARRKETIWQKDFSLGQVRPEAQERDDIDLVARSVKEGLNCVVLSTGQMEGRSGMRFLNATASSQGREVDLGEGRVFDLHFVPSGLILYDSNNTVEYTGNITWTAAPKKWGIYTFDEISFWVVADPDSSSILIGSQHFPIQALILNEDGSWSFGEMAFATGLAGAIHQSYWRYNETVSIQPSARTGAITVTASEAIWTAAHEGMAIRYQNREIILGTLVSSTVINATVTEELPPTYDITVSSVSNYQVGEAVEHSVLGGEGIITGIAGSVITVMATSRYDGFDTVASPKLVAPNAAQPISAVAAAATPAATFIWEMQMQSPVHGYAGYAVRHLSRVFLCDFPGAPQAFAASVVGAINDFKMGSEDADGFVDTVGADSGGTLRFMASVEDLLFLTSKGIYSHQTRDGSAITPATIRPVRFSRVGCASVEPIAVDDGCVFVDAVGQRIYAATLAGDIYTKWRAEPMTSLHPQLIKDAVYLGATSSGSENAESFVYVVNSDGSVALGQWDRSNEIISWLPWETDGNFLSIYQCFGVSHAVVDRTVNETSVRYRERFDKTLVLDCAGEQAPHLNGHIASVYLDGWDLGDNEINGDGDPIDADGNVIAYPDHDGMPQIGLVFRKCLTPWPRKSMRTERGTLEVKRQVSLKITVQDSHQFEINGELFGAYRIGEDLTKPPPLRNEEFRTTLVGVSSGDSIRICQNRPGRLRVSKLGIKVVV